MKTSVLPSGVELQGEIRGSGDLVIRGTLQGEVELDGVLTVEAGAVLRGPVRARAMVVRGLVEGSVTVLELLRLEAGAQVVGDVQADRVSASTGSVLRGRVRMTGADRLRRTVGGTITAPFTSSGTLDAPKLNAPLLAETHEPLPRQTLAALSHPHHNVRERATEPPNSMEFRKTLRNRATDTPSEEMPRPPMSPAVPPSPPPSLTAPVPTTPQPTAPVLTAPPPPVFPSLGRVRSQRRGTPS